MALFILLFHQIEIRCYIMFRVNRSPLLFLIAAKNSGICFRKEESSGGTFYFVATDFNPLKTMTKKSKSSVGTAYLVF
jgi:hypothetical protein